MPRIIYFDKDPESQILMGRFLERIDPEIVLTCYRSLEEFLVNEPLETAANADLFLLCHYLDGDYTGEGVYQIIKDFGIRVIGVSSLDQPYLNETIPKGAYFGERLKIYLQGQNSELELRNGQLR